MSGRRKRVIKQRRDGDELAAAIKEWETLRLELVEARAQLSAKMIPQPKKKPTHKKRTTRTTKAKKATDKD